MQSERSIDNKNTRWILLIMDIRQLDLMKNLKKP